MDEIKQRIALAEFEEKNLIAYRFSFKPIANDDYVYSPGYCDYELAELNRIKEEKRWNSKTKKVEKYIEPYLAPDYLNDLNAIHNVEKMLKGEQCEDYWDELAEMSFMQQGMFPIVHATAAQKTKALLKVLNLWKE